MKYNEGANLDPSQVGGRGGGGSGGKIAIGGGAGVVVLILALLLGVNPGDVLGSGSGSDPGAGTGASQAPASPFAQCTRGSDIGQDRNCRFVAYTNSIQDYWGEAVQDYQVIKVTTFTGQISTACGTATSEVGPFYCSGDTSVYLDLGFFDELTTKLGAKGGDAAEAYVLAHEFGHHVQDLEGTLQRVQGGSGGTGPTSSGVRLELQADCYAGVWFNHATNDPRLADQRGHPGRPGRRARRRRGGRRRPDPEEDAGPGQPGVVDARFRGEPAEVAHDGLHQRRPERLRHLRVTSASASLRRGGRSDPPPSSLVRTTEERCRAFSSSGGGASAGAVS